MARGFSLLEAMMAVVLVGLFASAMLLPYTYGARAQQEGNDRTTAVQLASDLMERVICLPFRDIDGDSQDPGPDPGENSVPASFDNIDDYHGYTEQVGEMLNMKMEVMDNSKYAFFSRSVSCEYTDTIPPQACSSDCRYIQVTVTVYKNGKKLAGLEKLVSR
mgnify:CR=1 FL=1